MRNRLKNVYNKVVLIGETTIMKKLTKILLVFLASFLFATSTLTIHISAEENEEADTVEVTEETSEITVEEGLPEETEEEAFPVGEETAEADVSENETEPAEEVPAEEIAPVEEEILEEVETPEAAKEPVLQNANPLEGRSDEGYAYAVGISTAYVKRELIFFRSTEVYENGTSGTFTDICGNHYTGIVYAGFEDQCYFKDHYAPWFDFYKYFDSLIARNLPLYISVAPGQLIRPASTAYWFYTSRIVAMSFCEPRS